jgi:ankyrin repeat protein
MRNPVPGAKTPLIYAARDGRLEEAKLLVAAGARLETTDANQMTPLLTAIINNKLDVARYLVEAGGNVNAADWYGETPLWAAVDVRNLDVSGPARDNGVDRANALEFIKFLIGRGADINARVKEYPPERRFITGLGSLAWVDVTGQTPFFRAAYAGDVTVMKLLLEHGADPKISAYAGTTPLMAAAGVNWVQNQTFTEGPDAAVEAVKLCYDLGLDVNATNSMGLQAIHGAANRGLDGVIEFLASRGADLEKGDNHKRTPIVWAEGVFLATNAPEPKPTSIALLKKLIAERKAKGAKIVKTKAG